MKNIILTGFMGTGKTAVGRELERMLDMRLVDIDTEIETSQDMTISDIFKQYGEDRFRDLETEMIRRFSEENGLIVSTGGGAVLRQENMDLLRKNGVIFCLNASPETILERTGRTDERPLLKVQDPMTRIQELLGYRKPYYEKADFMLETDGKNPVEIADEIIELMKCRT